MSMLLLSSFCHLFLKLCLQLPCFFIHLQMLLQVLLGVVLFPMFLKKKINYVVIIYIRARSLLEKKKERMKGRKKDGPYIFC